MLGQQYFEPKATICFDLDSFVAADHLLRQIHEQVDFSFIRPLVADYYCLNNGRPSIDPEVFFRLVLIGYLYGISSDRRLCEAIHYHLAYRWFCRLSLQDKVPDHSSITRIRDRLGVAIFQQFFLEIVRQCREKGLVKAKRIMSDSTLIAANASLDSLTANDEASENITAPSSKSVRGISPPARKVSNQTHTSRTDPDATLAFKEGTPRGLKYKAHVAIDADSRVILDTQITTGACHESQVYLPQLAAIEKVQNTVIDEAIADRAYGSGEIIHALNEKSITPFLPLFSRRSGATIVKESDGFIYEADKDRYRCPAGRYLIPYPTVNNNTVTYHSSPDDCRQCPLKTQCTAKLKSGGPTRIVRRHYYQALFEETTKRMETALFKAKMAERFWKIEGIMGEAKNYHGLARAKYRGLAKMQIQAYLSASIQNIKRIIFLYWLLFMLFYRVFNKKSYLIMANKIWCA